MGIQVIKGKCMGYISFENSSQAETAIIEMGKTLFKGKKLTIELYKPKEKKFLPKAQSEPIP